MIKIKRLNPQSTLSITGYILFALLVVSAMLSTIIPYGKMLFNPRVLHYNVFLTATALTIGTLLPPLLGYTIGIQFTKVKSKQTRHFNGVLFGILAYWMMSTFSIILLIPPKYFEIFQNAQIILVNLLPSAVVAIITYVIAVNHRRSRQAKSDIIKYKPYCFALIGLIILLLACTIISSLSSQYATTINVYMFIPLIVIMSIGTVSYLTLCNSGLNILSKLTWSAISISIAYILVFVSSMIVTWSSYYVVDRQSMELQSIINITGWVIALISWIIYWYLQAKSLSKR